MSSYNPVLNCDECIDIHFTFLNDEGIFNTILTAAVSSVENEHLGD